MSREISVDWLGQKPAEPAPSIAISTNACQGSRTSGIRPKPDRLEHEAAAERGAGADPVDHGARRGCPAASCAADETPTTRPGGAEPEAADVVQVDDEERQHDPVPERVEDAADLQQPDVAGQPRIEPAERARATTLRNAIGAPLTRLDPKLR